MFHLRQVAQRSAAPARCFATFGARKPVRPAVIIESPFAPVRMEPELRASRAAFVQLNSIQLSFASTPQVNFAGPVLNTVTLHSSTRPPTPKANAASAALLARTSTSS